MLIESRHLSVAQRLLAFVFRQLRYTLLAIASLEIIAISIWVLLDGWPLRTYFGLLRHGRDLFLYFYWMYALLVAVLFVAGSVIWFRARPRPSILSTYFLLCPVVPATLSMYGIVHRFRETLLPHPGWVATFIVGTLLLAQIDLSFRLLAKTGRGGRLLVSSVLIGMLLFSNSVALVAGMSISGRWL